MNVAEFCFLGIYGFSLLLIICILQSEPYAMLKKTSEKFEGNDKYEGFAVDLAEQIATIVGFNYSIVPTNGHGSVDANGQWNGMIKELLEEVNIIYFNWGLTLITLEHKGIMYLVGQKDANYE